MDKRYHTLHSDIDPVSLKGELLCFRDQTTVKETKLLLDVWNKARRNKDGGLDKIPCRRNIKLRDLSDYIENIYVLNVHEEGEDFCVRLAGTGVEELVGSSLKGRCVSALPDSAWRLERYRKVVETKEPVISCSRLGRNGKPALDVEVLQVPVCSDKGEFDQIFCIFGVEKKSDN